MGLMALVAVAGLFGCNKPAPQKPAHTSGLDAESIPLGRLPRVAIPERYRIALKIDPRTDRFTGHTEIDVRFLKPRRALFLHGLDLNVSGVSVRLKSGQSFPAHFDQVDDSGVVRLIFVDKVPAGEATLVFDYDAPFNTSLQGLYKVVDRGDAYAFTQFEETDARRMFPSFDEPGFKTPFDITVVAPKSMQVVGNTPIKSAKQDKNGMVDVVLSETPPLPTYLVALAVGPLDIVDGGTVPPNRFRSKPLRIRGIAAKGEGTRMTYALSLTPKIVSAFEEYFGIGYPFRKLDMIAVPDFAAGAMENAGAIAFRERYLLLDQDASVEDKRGSLIVQAHEIAHQWFGDLVTPSWWDDTWLNESFANWAELKAAQAVVPDFDFSSEGTRRAYDVMDLDELPSARQIHQPIQNVDDLANAFDGITYDKGASVLAMFENYVGPEAWRKGIHAYLSKFAHRNATADDFVGTIAVTTGHPDLVGSFHDFIDRPGVPYMSITGGCSDGALTFVQSPYAPFGFRQPQRSWHVPVCIAGTSGRACAIADDVLSLPLGKACAIPPMPDGTGYFRFAYDEDDWKSQIARAGKLDNVGQIVLLANVFAGLRSGKAAASDYFNAIRAVAPTARWDVFRQLSSDLPLLRRSLSDADIPHYRAFLTSALLPRWKGLGVLARSGERPADALLRQYLAVLLVTEAREPGVSAQLAAPVRCRFAPSSGCSSAIAPELRSESLRAALIANPNLADPMLKELMTTDQEALRKSIVYAFAGSDDPQMIDKLLTLALAHMRTGELGYLRDYMADEPVARDALWSFVKARYDDFARRLTQPGMGGMARILDGACDQSAVGEVKTFLQDHLGGALGARRRAAQTVERIERCAAFKKAEGAEIASALTASP
ncbi:MAG: M1 family metallopeptidase [Proteobacteria bacterium]|nr:M1 family metallopeptidase [Pseudomonadota bacterium]